MREGIRHHVAPGLLLQTGSVPDGIGGPQGGFEVAWIENGFGLLGVVGPESGQKSDTSRSYGDQSLILTPIDLA